MFNRLPGAMLKERHTRECRRGRSCGRALWHDTAAADVSELNRFAVFRVTEDGKPELFGTPEAAGARRPPD